MKKEVPQPSAVEREIHPGRRRFCQASLSALAAAIPGLGLLGAGPAANSATTPGLSSPKMPQSVSSSQSGNAHSISHSNTISHADNDDQRIADLVTGNHILFDQGVVDGFGHISARCVKNPAHFWLSQSRAPGIVTKDDILEFNEDSQPVNSHGRPLYSERFIHGEVYRARPDVISVVHSHSTAVIPFGVTGVALRPVIHTAGFLPQVTPVFEIRDAAGEDNGILVATNQLGAALAKALGKSPVVLMRGHGDTVVGPSVKAAVYRAVYVQLDAQVQAESLMLGGGKVTYLNPMEATNVDKMTEGNGVERVWQIWEARANANLAALNAQARK